MEIQKQIAGYVRCHATHVDVGWHFEVVDEKPKVGVVWLETGDGEVRFAVNRASTVQLVQQLELFLLDWPEDQAKS